MGLIDQHQTILRSDHKANSHQMSKQIEEGVHIDTHR